MKPKPTEAQIEKLGEWWTGHLSRAPHRDMVTHNLAYVYEKQFDVDVKFLEQEGRKYQPAGVEIDGSQFFTPIEYDEFEMEHREARPYKPENTVPLSEKALRYLGNECVRLMNEGKDEELEELLWQYRDQYPDQIESFRDCSVEKPGEYRTIAVALDGMLYKSDTVPSYIKDPFELDVYIKGNTMRYHEAEKLVLPTDEEIEKIGKAIANACRNHMQFMLPVSVMHYTHKYRFRYYRIFDRVEMKKSSDEPKVEHVLGIVINGRLFKTAHAPAEISDIDTLSDIRRQSERINGKRKLPENLVDIIGARWIHYLEAEGEERARLDAVKDEYLHSYYYQYVLHSTAPAVDYRHPTGIEINICGKWFLTNHVQREMFRYFTIEEYCQNRILQNGKPKPSPEEIEELGRRYQYYMVATLDREEALRDALEYEFQFNTEARFLYPKDRAYWCGGPIAVEIEGRIFNADFEAEFNDVMEDEKNPQEEEPYVYPEDRIGPTEEQVYELGMTYIEWVNEQSNRKRKKALRRQLWNLENKYRVEMHEIDRGHRTYEADAVLINRILFLSDKEDDFGVQYNVKWYCDEHDYADVAVKSDGSKKGCAPDDQLLSGMIFLRTKLDFSAYPDFEYEARTLTKYLGSKQDVVIPDGVKIIKTDAFADNETLRSVRISKTVSLIEASAFKGCSSLREIVVDPENPVYDSRDNCNAVILTERNALIIGCTDTKIPDSVVSIWNYAYSCNKNVTDITIPASVRYVAPETFDGCVNLKKICVDVNNPIFDSRNQCNAVIETKTNKLIVACAGTVIPDTVTTLSFSIFPKGTRLTNVTIPKSVISIGAEIFNGIDGPDTITVDKDNPVYDSRDNCNAIIDSFTDTLTIGCRNTVIPESVTAIGYSAFRNRTDLKTIRIPSTVKEIGNFAFSGCTSLRSAVIEDGVIRIGHDAFSHCEQLSSVIFPDSITDLGGGVLSYCKNLISVILPPKINAVLNMMFYHCGKLHSIVLPKDVHLIGECAFAGCENLRSVTFPKNLWIIAEHAFWNCKNLETIESPTQCQSLGYGAFEGCTKLKNTDVTRGITDLGFTEIEYCDDSDSLKLGPNTLYILDIFNRGRNISKITVHPDNPRYDSRNNCNALIETRTDELVFGCKTTVIPSSVRRIGVSAFEGTNSLTSIEIPEGVVSIGSLAFQNCKNLESVILPKSLENIGEYAFAYCPNLKNVEIRNRGLHLDPTAFHNSPYRPDKKK